MCTHIIKLKLLITINNYKHMINLYDKNNRQYYLKAQK